MLDNDRLMGDLAGSRAAIAGARAYLDEPTCKVRFGEAHLERCRVRHASILGKLRANRLEGLRLLGEWGSGV
jgi:hypothetical protein